MNRKATVLVLAVFLLGAAIGATVMYIADQRVVRGASPKPQQWTVRVVKDLTEQLNLTPQQQEQLSAILNETKAKYDAIYEPVKPQMEQARQEGRAKIRTMLTAEQMPRYEEYLKRLDERRKQMDKSR